MKALLVPTILLLPLALGCSDGPSQDAFCERAKKYAASYDQEDPTNEEAIAGIKGLVEVAPAEIKADAETLLSFVTAVAADASGTELPDITEPSLRFSAYLSDKCGIAS